MLINKFLHCATDKGLPRSGLRYCRALVYIIVALYIAHIVAFEIDKEVSVDGDLTLGKSITRTTCNKKGYQSVGNTLCIQEQRSDSKVTMHTAIKQCGDQFARVCTLQDLIYVCANGQENLVKGGMWLGNYLGANSGGQNVWGTTNEQCSTTDYNFDGDAVAQTADRYYRCCY